MRRDEYTYIALDEKLNEAILISLINTQYSHTFMLIFSSFLMTFSCLTFSWLSLYYSDLPSANNPIHLLQFSSPSSLKFNHLKRLLRSRHKKNLSHNYRYCYRKNGCKSKELNNWIEIVTMGDKTVAQCQQKNANAYSRFAEGKIIQNFSSILFIISRKKILNVHQ